MLRKTEALFDTRTFTLTYVVWDEKTRDAVVIDPAGEGAEPRASREVRTRFGRRLGRFRDV